MAAVAMVTKVQKMLNSLRHLREIEQTKMCGRIIIIIIVKK
jgi:hypothetical protein